MKSITISRAVQVKTSGVVTSAEEVIFNYGGSFLEIRSHPKMGKFIYIILFTAV